MARPRIVPIHIDVDTVNKVKEAGLAGTLLSVTYEYLDTNSKDMNLKLERLLFTKPDGTEVWEEVLTHDGFGASIPGDNERIVYVEPTEYVGGGPATAEVYPYLTQRYRWTASGADIDGEVFIYMLIKPD